MIRLTRSCLGVICVWLAGAPIVAAVIPDKGAVRLNPAPGARFSFEGFVGARIRANLGQWLLVAPDSNPGMTGMFRVRDREPAPDLVPWAGEFVGKYLLSAIPMLRMTDDPRLEQQVRRVVEDVIAGQAPDGYIGPFRKPERLLGHWDLWGHYHVMQALVMYSEERDYAPALDAACRAADLICRTYLDTPRRVFDAGSQEMNMAVIHVLARLYRKTGNEDYRRMTRRIEEDWQRAGDYFRTGVAGLDFYRTPRPRWESLHDLQGLTELFRITGEPAYRTALLNHWQSIRQLDRHNTGAFSTGEGAVGSPYRRGSIETCCTVAWMAMTIDALTLTGDSTVADELEWSFFNAMLGAQHPSGRWWTYDTPMDGTRAASAHAIVFQARPGTPELNCCSVNGPRSLAMLADWAVMLDDDGVVLNYYGPVRVSMPRVNGTTVDILQETAYPAEGRVRISVNPREPRRFPFKLRMPAWSKTTTVRVNDDKAAQAEPGRYFVLDRRWSPGDAVTIVFDMTPRYWTGEAEVAGCASFYRGPLLLAFDQYYNERDTHQIPTIDLRSLELRVRDVSADDRFPPMVLCDLMTAEGGPIRLCDFATAGARGTHYRTWLPARGGRPADFFLRNPRCDEAVPAGPLLFQWISYASPDPHATTCDLVVGWDERFEKPVLTRTGLRRGRYVYPEGLESGKRYYWKVTARNAGGTVDNADGPRQFTIDPAMPALKVDCLVLADGPDALAIAAPLDGTPEPRRGCLAHAIDVTPAADRHDRSNAAVHFNGRSSKVSFTIPEFPQDAYSVSAWIRVEAFSKKMYQQVFSAWTAGMDDPLRISVMGDGLCARIERQQVSSTPAVKLELDAWMHVAAVKDGETLKLYINGQCRATSAAPKRVLSASCLVALGANPSFPGDEYFQGCIDEFRFYARALTEKELAEACAAEQ
jgi:DUF1680 family protein